MRTPLCGRNYDYFGEDPWLAGRITVGYVRGMQAEQTVANLKHFALNNQETERGSIDVAGRRADAARDLPARVRGRRPRRRGALGDGRLQQGARPARLPQRLPAQPGAEARVGVRGCGHLRLGRHARHRRGGPQRPRSRDGHARALRAVLPRGSRSWRASAAAAIPSRCSTTRCAATCACCSPRAPWTGAGPARSTPASTWRSRAGSRRKAWSCSRTSRPCCRSISPG